MISNGKVSESKSSPRKRNKREKEKENVKTREGTYADVVKKGIEEKMEGTDAVMLKRKMKG